VEIINSLLGYILIHMGISSMTETNFLSLVSREKKA